jgi:exonuclease III
MHQKKIYGHKDVHKFTWEARGTRSIIDYIIINERLKSNIKDTRVFRGSGIDSDHMLVESKFKFYMQNINTTKRIKQYTRNL